MRITIGLRLTTVLLVLVVAFALGAYLYVPRQVRVVAENALHQRATAEASLLAQAVKPYIEFEQLDAAQETLDFAKADPLVSWVAIYDAGGRMLVGGASSATKAMAKMPEAWQADEFDEDMPVEVAFALMGEEDNALGYIGLALDKKAVERELASVKDALVYLAFFVLLAGALAAVLLSRSIATPLGKVTQAARRIASGDVSADLDIKVANDEVGDLAEAFQTMTRRLRDLAGRLTDGSESLAAAAAGMLSSVRQQEAHSTQQTASLEEIRQTLQALSEAAEEMARGSEKVQSMAAESLHSTQETAERARLVSEHSERIGEILGLIQNIADKSDLLALNASLEGTKAGDVGRGFSLVAAEMRRLSEHVMDSVRDIRKLIADSREASHASVLASERGIKIAKDTSHAAAQISATADRHRDGTSQVKASADEIVRVVNDSLAGQTDTTRSAENLLQFSQELKKVASIFRVR